MLDQFERQYELCQSHTDRLAGLAAGQEASFKLIIDRLDKINGRLNKHDDQILKLDQRKGAEESFFITNARDHASIEDWKADFEGDLKELEADIVDIKQVLATISGGKKVAVFFGTIILTLLSTIVSLAYQSYILRTDVVHIEEMVKNHVK